MAELRIGRVTAVLSAAVFAGALLFSAAVSLPKGLHRGDGAPAFWQPLLHARDRAALALGADAVGDVYITKTRMLRRRTAYDPEALRSSAEALRALAQERDVPLFLLLAPTAAGIYADALPAHAPLADESAMLRQAAADLTGSVTWIETAGWLNELRDEAIYYRTDSRWTTFGAYYAYKTAARRLGFNAIGYDRLIITHADSNYYGDLARETGVTAYPPDIIDLYQYDTTGSPLQLAAIREDGAEPLPSYFQPETAEQTGDPFAVFAAVTEPVLRFTSERQSGRRLLLLADSSAACILPLLAQHYASVTAVNLELTDGVPWRALAEQAETEYSQVLVLCSAEAYASGQLAAALSPNETQ